MLVSAYARAGLVLVAVALVAGCRTNTDRIRVLEAEKADAERRNSDLKHAQAELRAEKIKAEGDAESQRARLEAAEAQLEIARTPTDRGGGPGHDRHGHHRRGEARRRARQGRQGVRTGRRWGHHRPCLRPHVYGWPGGSEPPGAGDAAPCRPDAQADRRVQPGPDRGAHGLRPHPEIGLEGQPGAFPGPRQQSEDVPRGARPWGRLS